MSEARRTTMIKCPNPAVGKPVGDIPLRRITFGEFELDVRVSELRMALRWSIIHMDGQDTQDKRTE